MVIINLQEQSIANFSHNFFFHADHPENANISQFVYLIVIYR